MSSPQSTLLAAVLICHNGQETDVPTKPEIEAGLLQSTLALATAVPQEGGKVLFRKNFFMERAVQNCNGLRMEVVESASL